MSDAHRLIFTVSPFLALHYGTMDVGNDGVGVRNIALKLRNDCLGVRNTLMDVGNDGMSVPKTFTNVGNGYICVYCKFGLEVDN